MIRIKTKAKLEIFILALIFSLSACNSDSWSVSHKSDIREKIKLDEMRSLFFTEEMANDFSECCMEKIIAEFNYSDIKDIQLSDSTIKNAQRLNEIRKNCWESLLKSNEENLNSKGIEVVIPE